MTKNLVRFAVGFAAAVLIGSLFFADVQASADTEGTRSVRNEIQVANVEELYNAVNDPLNAGRQIIAAPGIYMLSAFDPGGSPRPNGGRLEFQEDMSLVGVVGDREAVVINAINMPSSSLTGGTVPLAPIRLGRGRNSVEWLTLRDSKFGLGNIVNGLAFSGTPHIRIAHIASTGAAYGISFFNFGPAFSGKTLELDIVDNDLFEAAVGLRTGFRIGNFAGATGSVVNARLTGNRVWGNQFSLIVNNGVSGSKIDVVSSGNRYFDNGAGLVVVGGIGGAANNIINYSGRGDRFTSNDEALAVDRGGLLFFGGDRPFVTSTLGASGNTIYAKLFGCRMEGNAHADLLAVGGRSIVPAFISTVFDNRVILELKGMPTNAEMVEFFADNVPNDPVSNNSITVNR